MTVPHGLTSAHPVIAGLGFTSAEAVDDGATARADSQTADWTEAEEASFEEAAPPPSEPLPPDPDGDDSQTTGEILAGDIPDVSSAAETDTGGPDGEEVDPETTPQAADPTTTFDSSSTAARAREVDVGLTESDPATLEHPQGDAFGQTRKLRPFVYWDIMRLIDRFEKRQPLNQCERRAVRSWISYRKQVNKRPSGSRVAVMVSFSGRASPAEQCKTSAPDPGLYHRAIRKFLNDPRHRLKKEGRLTRPIKEPKQC